MPVTVKIVGSPTCGVLWGTSTSPPPEGAVISVIEASVALWWSWASTIDFLASQIGYCDSVVGVNEGVSRSPAAEERRWLDAILHRVPKELVGVVRSLIEVFA